MKKVVAFLQAQWLLGVLLVLLGIIAVRALHSVRVYNDIRPAARESLEPTDADLKTAYVAGGCFWCTETDFEQLDGVVEAVSGYMNGTTEHPTYENYHEGGHTEAVQVVYDSRVLSYEDIVRHLFDHIDFLDGEGQFVDRGHAYTSAVFYQNQEEQEIAEKVVKEFDTSGVYSTPVVTRLEPFNYFYPAEDYHQDYHTKNKLKYSYYRGGSGRDARVDELCAARMGTSLPQCGAIKELAAIQARLLKPIKKTPMNWKAFTKPSDDVLKSELSELSYEVTQHEATEPPVNNPYDKNYEPGIYVDVVSGEPLYSSSDKFDSGTGWPSFVKPITNDAVKIKTDWKLIYPRSEVRSTVADSHLGHVFNDGPGDRGGKRYCMNSAALRFIPLAEMEAEGYGEYISAVTQK